MYQAVVFFDLDGTLLNSKKKVPISSLTAIQILKAKKILPVIATGRNLLMVKKIMQVTHISTVISANGSYIQYRKQPLNIIPIPVSVIQRLIAVAKQFNHPLAFQTADQIVLNAKNFLTRRAYLHHSVNPEIKADFFKDHLINFINIFTIDHDQFYQNKFANQLNIVRNSDKCLDVMKSGVSKQLGIKILLQRLNLLKCPTYAFGDGLNDLEMFKEVKHPIAMNNGCQQCKDYAEYITTSNDHDGIERGLRYFNLI